MRILVTGGAGFIGKHLCRRLVSEGHDVTSWDCGLYRDDELPAGVRIERGDVLNGTAIMRLAMEPNDSGIRLKGGTWDRCYHLACHASPKRYQRDPINTAMVCTRGIASILSWTRISDHCRTLLASTSEIYGEPEVHPQPESYRGNVNCLGIRACYDEGKRMAECLMMDYHRQYGVDTRIARIFNTYGPLMDFDDGRVISNFITQALKGEPLTIYGDGSQTRSFCYVDDMVEGLIRLMEYEGPECHEPHNLGNPEENAIRWITSEVCWAVHDVAPGLIQEPPPFEFKPLPQDDPTRRCPDITRAKQNLGWEPRVGLSEGLKRTVEDFRARLQMEAVR